MRACGVALGVVLLATSNLAFGQTTNELTPSGTLRVGVLVINPVLITKMPNGTLGGVSVDLGRLVAKKLGARYQEVTYESTETFAKSFGAGEWDILIGPKTPIAEKTSDLSPPFMLVDNIYVAAPGRNFSNASEVDRPGVKIAVVFNGAPDQYLSKSLKAASLVRIKGSEAEIIEALRTGKADVYGSNAENVHAAAEKLPGSKIIHGAFRTVSMVVAFPKGKSTAAQKAINDIVLEAKSSGLILNAIEKARLKGVRVAN